MALTCWQLVSPTAGWHRYTHSFAGCSQQWIGALVDWPQCYSTRLLSKHKERYLAAEHVLQGAHLAKGCCVPHVTCANRNLPLRVPAWQPHTVLPTKRGSETGVEPRRALAPLNRHPSRAPLASSGWKGFRCRPWPTHTPSYVRTSVLFTR